MNNRVRPDLHVVRNSSHNATETTGKLYLSRGIGSGVVGDTILSDRASLPDGTVIKRLSLGFHGFQ